MYMTPLSKAEYDGINIYLHGENGVTEKIKKAMYDVAKQFVYIGFLLWEVKQYDYYSQSGYKDVYDYAQQELGFKRTSTKNFIAIAETFGNKYYDTYDTTRSILPTMQLQPKYEKFNYSQLCEMLSLSDRDRDKVTPDMTIKQIRSLKQSQTSSSYNTGQTSDQIAESNNTEFINLPKIVNNHFYDVPQEYQDKYKSVLINNIWKDINEDFLLELINASGLKKTKNMCYNITIKVHED